MLPPAPTLNAAATLDAVPPDALRRPDALALAPMRLLQRMGLGGLVRRMGRLLPRSLRLMQEIVPPLAPHYGRLPEVLPAEGKRRARVALFTGCAADAFFPQTNLATARVLQRNGCEVWIPRAPGLLRGPALPRRPGGAGAAVGRRQLRGVRQG